MPKFPAWINGLTTTTIADDDRFATIDASTSGTIHTKWSLIKSTLQAAFDSRYLPFTEPFSPARSLLSSIRGGETSQTMVALGDSTTNAADEWYGLTAAWLATEAADHVSVIYAPYDSVNDDTYDAVTVLQAGDGTGPIVLSDTFTRADGAAGEAESSASSVQTWPYGSIVSGKFTGSSNASAIETGARDVYATMKVSPPTTGDCRFYFHATSITNAIFVQVIPARLRIYKFIGGAATMLAEGVVSLTAGTEYDLTVWSAGPKFTATIGAVTVTTEVNMIEFTAIDPTDRKIGLSCTATDSDGWFDDLVVRAAPTLICLNAGVGSTDPSYHSDATRFTKVMPYAPDLVLISHAHNMGTQLTDASYDTLATKITSTYAGTPMAFSTQNPETDARGTSQLWHVQFHNNIRQQVIRTFALQNGHGLIDAFARFRFDDPTGADYDADGTHPNPAGNAAWALEARALFGASPR